MRRLFLYSLMVLFFVVFVSGESNDKFPVPQGNEKMLFYLQRSLNKNTVIYEVNFLSGTNVDPDKPVHIYWIRYEEDGSKKELSTIQYKAYGLNHQKLRNNSFLLHFRSHDLRKLILVKENNVYKVLIDINGERAILKKIFVELGDNFLGLHVNVKYIIISGISLKSKKYIIERYVP